MAHLMDNVRIWIEQIIELLGYPGIALVMLVENLFPPIPSELVMPFGGFLVASGKMSFLGILAAGTLGSVTGAVALYYIGQWADEPLVRRSVRRFGWLLQVSEADLDRALNFFQKYGDAVVFTGRLVPIIRSLISLPAGMKRMPMGRFLLFTTFGSVIWNSLLAYAGVVLGENWTDILAFVKQYERLTLAVVVLGGVAFLVTRLVQSRKNKGQSVRAEVRSEIE